MAAEQAPFRLVLSGLGEFATATRVVAWLGIEEGAEQLIDLRKGLARCDRDVLPYTWRPHCTLLYAEQPDAYPAVRPAIGEVLAGERIEVEVDALWIAGFPATGHAALRPRVPAARPAAVAERARVGTRAAPGRHRPDPAPSPPYTARQMEDRLHRPLHDLRISLTDRCNFRCTYCMPKEVFGPGYRFLGRNEVLSFEELERLTRVFAGLGVRKVRLTGGEPLLRRDADALVARLAAIEGIDDLTMTTNGSLLRRHAKALAAAGLTRVTVSLDSLDEDVFRAMNDVDFPVAKVLDGIDAALEAGLGPVKVNAVVKRGVNDQGIEELAARFRGTGVVLRFIEFMDVGSTNGWRLDDVVPAQEIVDRIGEAWPLEPVGRAVSGRGRESLALPRRGGRGRRDRVRHAAVLRRLLARPHLGRGPPVHVPVRSRRPRPAPAAPRRDRRRRPGAARAWHLAPARRPLLGAAHGRDVGRAQGRDCRHHRLRFRRGMRFEAATSTAITTGTTNQPTNVRTIAIAANVVASSCGGRPARPSVCHSASSGPSIRSRARRRAVAAPCSSTYDTTPKTAIRITPRITCTVPSSQSRPPSPRTSPASTGTAAIPETTAGNAAPR